MTVQWLKEEIVKSQRIHMWLLLVLLADGFARVCAAPAVARTAVEPSNSLAPLAYMPARLGRVKPGGWLLNQLEIQGT